MDIHAYKNISNIHMYMRDNATYETEEMVYKPATDICMLEEDLSGLSKIFVTKQDYDEFWNNTDKLFKNIDEINGKTDCLDMTGRPYKIHVIMNPISKRVIRDPDENIKALDKEILDTFIHFKTYGNTYEILSSIIYNN